MLVRTPETEVMNDPREARAYDDMDHAAVNAAFVGDLLASGLLDQGPVDHQADTSFILDVGTGTALIPVELCRRFENCQVIASDAATCMLDIARINVAIGLCEHRIQLHHGDGKQLEYSDDLFDGVMSNSWLHHLPQPAQGLSEMWRVCKPGGWLFTRDLLRPESAEEVERLVQQHAQQETTENQQLLRQSLHAALALEEARAMVSQLGLPGEAVQATSDRHWTFAARKV
jgi:ubiquinone/menaquinone biosynthesis C-methylase UbiE